MPGPVLSERDLAVLRSFARRIDPSDAGAHNNLGVLYYQKGLVADAIAAFTRALELDPKIAYHDTGYYDQRVAQLRERLRQAPDERDARWELGRAYAILGQQDEAIGEFEQLVAQKPDDVAAIIQLGLAEKNRGRPEAATEWFLRARELDPNSSVAQFYLGEIYYNRGLNGDARAALERAVQLNPPLARAQTNLSLERYNAERRRQRQRAREVPEPQVVEGNELAHYNLGLAFRQKGYYNEALREYRLALERG